MDVSANGNKDINVTQDELIESFEFFDDWMDKYQLIISRGKHLPSFDKRFQTEEYLVRGCQSQVWFYHVYEGNKLYFYGMSESAIVQGLLSMLIEVYSGHSPKMILNTPPRFIEAIGLSEHLSPTRNNGLYAVLEKVRQIAKQYATSMKT